jgi:hypothetical protein
MNFLGHGGRCCILVCYGNDGMQVGRGCQFREWRPGASQDVWRLEEFVGLLA